MTAEENARQIEQRKARAVRSQGRDAAVLRGRLYGQDTARQRGETGALKDERIARAMAYAAWEYDGKPAGGPHMKEFGVGAHDLNGVVRGGADLKKEKK